jgi:hypothetical protein
VQVESYRAQIGLLTDEVNTLYASLERQTFVNYDLEAALHDPNRSTVPNFDSKSAADHGLASAGSADESALVAVEVMRQAYKQNAARVQTMAHTLEQYRMQVTSIGLHLSLS